MEIAIITPSSPCNPEAFNAGLDILRSWGHTVLLSPNSSREPRRYLAGTVFERLAEIEWALNSSADLIMAGRGGYGAHQLLPDLANLMKRAPEKPLMGFSDITALHQLWQLAGWKSYHGPNVTTLAKLDSDSTMATKSLLYGQLLELPIHDGDHGELIGGNLAMLASLAGTPYLYKSRRPAILFLEDIGERPYRLDRLLQQLLMAEYFDNVKAVYLGEFKDCEPAGEADYSAIDVVLEFFEELGIPCFSGFPTGHGSVNHPI